MCLAFGVLFLVFGSRRLEVGGGNSWVGSSEKSPDNHTSHFTLLFEICLCSWSDRGVRPYTQLHTLHLMSCHFSKELPHFPNTKHQTPNTKYQKPNTKNQTQQRSTILYPFISFIILLLFLFFLLLLYLLFLVLLVL